MSAASLTREDKIRTKKGNVIFCSLYKHTSDNVFDDFLKISSHFPKISEDSPKVVRRPEKRFFFPHIFRKLPKIAEDFRGRTNDVSDLRTF